MDRRPSRTIGALAILAAILTAGGAARADRGAQGAYPQTRQVIGELVASGEAWLVHYRLSEAQARSEGQPYLADLFKAMAFSQTVMNRNFRDLLDALSSGETACAAAESPRPSTTRRNLIAAIRQEIRETDTLYPEALERIAPEGHLAATTLLVQALRAHQLRRGDMREIHLGARYFYSRLQTEVRRRAPVYYICQQSGTLVLNELPAVCPVRGASTASYRALNQFPAAAEWQACRAEPAARHL